MSELVGKNLNEGGPASGLAILLLLLNACTVLRKRGSLGLLLPGYIYASLAYQQGCHNVLISKLCPYFEGLRLRKYFCPYF